MGAEAKFTLIIDSKKYDIVLALDKVSKRMEIKSTWFQKKFLVVQLNFNTKMKEWTLLAKSMLFIPVEFQTLIQENIKYVEAMITVNSIKIIDLRLDGQLTADNFIP